MIIDSLSFVNLLNFSLSPPPSSKSCGVIFALRGQERSGPGNARSEDTDYDCEQGISRSRFSQRIPPK